MKLKIRISDKITSSLKKGCLTTLNFIFIDKSGTIKLDDALDVISLC